MTKKLRQEVYGKYNGKCAYTGKPLGDDWQVDHITPQRVFDDNKYIFESNDERWRESFRRTFKTDCTHKDDIDNLLPALRIVNHYKRALGLEDFREYLRDFHIRLGKLPKNPRTDKTRKRIAYMNEIARAFDITPDKSFCGLFYFEKTENG